MPDERLHDVLERSRELGFLGPGPVEDHIHHALTFRAPLEERRLVLDLGSGGGVPGLVLAWKFPELRITLLDAMEKRCRFLEGAAEELGVAERVDVLCGRAEELARDPRWRGRFDAVVARSFGPPAVTAESAVGFLQGEGALLVVSEPPELTVAAERWPAEGLEILRLEPGPRIESGVSTLQVLRATGPCLDRFPRRVGVPSKRPLF